MKKLKIGMLALMMTAGSMAWTQRSATNASAAPVQTQSAAPEQVAKTPVERATAHSKKLTEKLGLTPDQQKSIYDFCLQRAQQEDADRAKFQNDREGMRNARKQNEASFEKNLSTVLTADQKTKYEQMKQEEKEKRQEKWGNKD